MIDKNQLPNDCYSCKNTWPDSLWKHWNSWRDKEWSHGQLQNLITEDHVRTIEIMLGITCNQTCMYCTEFVSSKWADLKSIPITVDNEWETLALNNLFDYIKTDRYNDSNAIWYNFLGGEPLLEPRIFDVVEKLIDIHNEKNVLGKTITINMTTNLNIKPKTIDRYIELVEKNSNIIWTMSASIDSIGTQGEEIRDGLIFSRFENNLEKIYSCGKFQNINILPSVSCLSIPNKSKLIQWYIDLSIKYRKSSDFGRNWSIASNVVTWPDAMHPGILPEHYRSEIDICINIIKNLEGANQSVINNCIVHLENVKSLIGTKRTQADLEQAMAWYKDQGKIKNKNYLEIFPFLKEIL